MGKTFQKIGGWAAIICVMSGAWNGISHLQTIEGAVAGWPEFWKDVSLVLGAWWLPLIVSLICAFGWFYVTQLYGAKFIKGRGVVQPHDREEAAYYFTILLQNAGEVGATSIRSRGFIWDTEAKGNINILPASLADECAPKGYLRVRFDIIFTLEKPKPVFVIVSCSFKSVGRWGRPVRQTFYYLFETENGKYKTTLSPVTAEQADLIDRRFRGELEKAGLSSD